MINKKMYMIWFGKDIPDYINNSIEWYKKINGEFDLQVIFYTIENLEDIYKSDVYNLSEIDKLLYHSIQLAKNQIISGRRMPCIPRISFFLRQKILNTYGGIYVDCDTFPIRPFDDELLSDEYFISCRYIKTYNFLLFDNCFSGQVQSTNNKIFHICKEYLTSELNYNVLYPLNERKIDYNLCKKFYNGTLKYGEYYGDPKFNYLDHYTLWNWNPDKCKIQETCIDKDIQKIKDHGINYV